MLADLLTAAVTLPDRFKVEWHTNIDEETTAFLYARSRLHLEPFEGNPHDPVLIAIGRSRLGPNDYPCAPVGQAYALVRALRSAADQLENLAVALDVLNCEYSDEEEDLWTTDIFS